MSTRPKTLRYREALDAAEQRIVTALPEIIDGLITRAKEGDLKTKLYAAMAQTDCTACGYDCEGYAAALAAGTEKDPNLCVPGKEETAKVVHDLLKGTGLPAANN